MVDAKELEEIKKLPPKVRLERLKELEEVRKKQEEDAKKIIEQSLKEIKLDEMLEEIEVPAAKKVDIDGIFEQKGVDTQLSAEELKKLEKGGDDYVRRIHELLPRDTLSEIKNWYVKDEQPPTKSEFLEVYDNARQAYDLVQNSLQNAPNQDIYATSSEKLVEDVVTSMHLLRSLGYSMDWFQH